LIQPLFIESGAERLFCIHREPVAHVPVRGSVLMLPAFAEEMNRTRSFVSRISFRLSEAGFHVLQPDLSGTGDSTGEFRNAEWSRWIEELRLASAWLHDKAGPVHLVALRAGALFLSDLLDAEPDRFARICLVEPFVTGADSVREFLQLRVARSIFEGTKESIAMLTEALAGGASMEVGGYDLSSGLYASLNDATIEDLGARLQHALVLGCGRSPETRRNAAMRALAESWCAEGADATYAFVATEPFWSQELPSLPTDAIACVVDFIAGAQA
tara:strand:- start:5511 stop:6326 length:816 start_codon:yes stop_codon:yes gene_type:complete